MSLRLCRQDQRGRPRSRQLPHIAEPRLRQPTRNLLEAVGAAGLGVDEHVHREDQPRRRAAPVRIDQEFRNRDCATRRQRLSDREHPV